MLDSRKTAFTTLTLSTLVLLRYYWRKSHPKVIHPPSPTWYPLVGNLLSLPLGAEHEAYTELGKQLNSDVVFLELLGNDIVILNSAQAASDLLEKRSALYSDRMCPPVLKEETLFDWSRATTMLGYNDTWRHHRRMMNNWLNTRAVSQFHKLQEYQAHTLLRSLLNVCNEPQLFEHVKDEVFFAAAASMFRLSFGYHLKSKQDSFFLDARDAFVHGFESVMLSNFYVNIFPALIHVPEWVPGTGWKRTIRQWREQKERALNLPFEWTKAQVEAGTSEHCIIGALLQDHNLTGGLSIEERDSRLKEVGLILYGAGTDTSSTVLLNFITAMVLHPEIQAKAQKEIDEVLGSFALPTMLDRERLPYLNNVILEVMRWRPILPIGLPHRCFQDDVYRGYDIKKGTIVIGNIWAMSRDESVYRDPDVFNPDRFLDPNLPPLPIFGWGRRKCPGLHFGDATVFIVAASLLSTFTFSKKKDSSGKDIEPKLENSPNSLVLEFRPFEFELKPRSEKHRQMILEAA